MVMSIAEMSAILRVGTPIITNITIITAITTPTAAHMNIQWTVWSHESCDETLHPSLCSLKKH